MIPTSEWLRYLREMHKACTEKPFVSARSFNDGYLTALESMIKIVENYEADPCNHIYVRSAIKSRVSLTLHEIASNLPVFRPDNHSC